MNRAQDASAPQDPARRALLQRGVLGGALLVLGGAAGLAVFPSRRVVPDPEAPLLVLTSRAYQVVAAVSRRVVQVPGADHAAIARGVDTALQYLNRESQDDLNSLLMLFENALPGLIDLRFVPFTRLDDRGQDAVLAAWRDSRITLRRTGYQALRKLCLAAHYGSPAAWARIGYPGPPNFAGLAYDDTRAGVVDAAAGEPARGGGAP